MSTRALSANHSELSQAPSAIHRRLDAALEEISALQRRELVLEQQIALLTEEAAHARQFAYHDELTGLPNRRLLLDRLQQAVAGAARHDKQMALLFLDLDRFKHINDTLGHTAGDTLLQQVAARLTACVRRSDTVCRYGGDEFVVLLSECGGKGFVSAMVGKICAHLERPYVIGGTSISLTASIGTAIYPSDGKDCGDLLQVSDLAMYGKKTWWDSAPRSS